MSADYHVHTASPRFGYSMEAMAETALKLKLSSLCFTEHMDLDFPGGDTSFHVDTQAYYKKYLSLQECFAEQIELSSESNLGFSHSLPKSIPNIFAPGHLTLSSAPPMWCITRIPIIRLLRWTYGAGSLSGIF